MGSLWDDRLAEVWAPPGRAGSGVVVGAFGVLTARHVVAEVVDGSAAGGALTRVIRRGAPPAWVPMRVAADAAEWDLAMLEVDRDRPEAAAWVPPASSSPVMVAVDAGSVEGCEAVGFPSEEVQQRDGAGPAEVVRQSEQLRGTLLPKGQAKPPVAPRPGLPREWMPLDASTATPGEQAGWRGMSGAGVLLPDGRLAAVVVAAESGHQQRRLYVVPLAPALATAPDLAAALATVTGAAVVVEAQPAPAYRRVLYRESLRADGTPLQLGEVADLGVFGVKPVDLAGEPIYLNYVPRDDDGRLGEALREAAAARQALLLVGDSGSGKTRSAAQAARDTYGTHRLLRPAEHQLAQLPDLPLAGLGPVLVWLDDVEKYAHPALREILQRMLDAGMVVVGTIRREELQALAVTGEIRNPSGEALTDERLVQRLDWKREWSQPERDRTAEYINSPLAWQAVSAGLPLGVWAVAGPRLLQELDSARSDEDYPCRFKLVRAALDWYRTGLTDPLPWPVAVSLINRAYLDQPASDKELGEARDWCTQPISIGGRRGRYSLLTLHDDGLAINDYIQDHDRRHGPPPMPDPTWAAALANASGTTSLWNVGSAAYSANQMVTAEAAMRTLADAGETGPMYNLGLLLNDRDPDAARRWWEQAAAAGDAHAMNALGLLLNDRDPDAARRWYEQAAEHGHADAMDNLGLLLKDRDPDAARLWWEQAAEHGHASAMNNLGVLLVEGDPDAARRWWEQAAAAGDADAMNALGLLLNDRDPDASRRWYEQAAAGGQTNAMNILGVLLVSEGHPDAARRWWEQAAEHGHADAMFNLGVLLDEGDPDAARRWYEQAAAAGDTAARNNLGVIE
jgi:TPR repeat protein